jgi:ComF family protein
MKANLKEALADLLFPRVRCLACNEPRKITPDTPLCPSCLESLQGLQIKGNVCGRCLSPLKAGQACAFCAKGGMESIEKAYAPFIYRDVVQRLIVQLKFVPCLSAAPLLASHMARCITGLSFDALVPVPLSREHQRERGMNQSLELCRQISPVCGIPILEALVKTTNTRRQSHLPAQLREKNVKGAYRCVQQAEGLRLLLVDDVRTTGSTANSCARELRKHGAASVCLLTAAVASARHTQNSKHRIQTVLFSLWSVIRRREGNEPLP